MPARLAVLLLIAAALSLGFRGTTVAEKLRRSVSIEVYDVPLDRALVRLGEAADAVVRIPQRSFDVLPFGRETPVSIRSDGATLGETLDALAGPLGMRVSVDADAGVGIELEPLPVLARSGRRATAEELTLAMYLRDTPMPGADGETDDAEAARELSVERLVESADAVLLAAEVPYKVELRTGDDMLRDAIVRLPREASLLDALEAAADQTAAGLRLDGGSAVLDADRAITEARLGRTVTARYDRSDLTQVLVDLSRRSGVPFAIEPGAVSALPEDVRSITLRLERATVRQALDAIAAKTGLGFAVTGDGVSIRLPGGLGNGSGVLVLIPADDGTLIPITADDVSPAVAEALLRQREAAIERLTEAMGE